MFIAYDLTNQGILIIVANHIDLCSFCDVAALLGVFGDKYQHPMKIKFPIIISVHFSSRDMS